MAITKELVRALKSVERFCEDIDEIAPSELDCVALEREAQDVVQAIGLEMMRKVLRHADTTAPEVEINGERWGNMRLSPGTYTTIFGELSEKRATYQRPGGGPVAVPVELRLRIVEGRYTPVMARIMSRAVALMPEADAEGFLHEVGVAEVSKSTLHRIPRAMAARYELHRAHIEPVVRERDVVPDDAAVMQVALDGVMVPQDGEHTKPRGRKTDNPAPPRHEQRYGAREHRVPADDDEENGRAWHEASVATVAFWKHDGEHLKTIYLGQMPEEKKATLVARLEAEAGHALACRPDLDVCFASDGALTHWDALEAMASRLPNPEGQTRALIVDRWHVEGYLGTAATVAAGAGTPEAEVLRATLSETLREFDDGASRVLRMLRYRRDQLTSSKREEMEGAIDFLANQARHGRMNYAAARAAGLPVGTGVTEAAAKTLVNVRIKRAGTRLGRDGHGGQTILLFRSAVLSERFQMLSQELEATYGATLREAA